MVVDVVVVVAVVGGGDYGHVGGVSGGCDEGDGVKLPCAVVVVWPYARHKVRARRKSLSFFWPCGDSTLPLECRLSLVFVRGLDLEVSLSRGELALGHRCTATPRRSLLVLPPPRKSFHGTLRRHLVGEGLPACLPHARARTNKRFVFVAREHVVSEPTISPNVIDMFFKHFHGDQPILAHSAPLLLPACLSPLRQNLGHPYARNMYMVLTETLISAYVEAPGDPPVPAGTLRGGDLGVHPAAPGSDRHRRPGRRNPCVGKQDLSG